MLIPASTAQNELNMTSATHDGYRFVGRWVQDAMLVSNHGPRYVYQGFTNDGAYLVSFWWPVTSEALPDRGEPTAEQVVAFTADPVGAFKAAAIPVISRSNPSDQVDIPVIEVGQ